MESASFWHERAEKKQFLYINENTMKNMLLLCIVGLLLACGGGEEPMSPTPPDVPELPEELVLTVAPSVLNATAIENTYEIKITTTGKEWAVSSADEWLKLVPEKGDSNEGTIKVTIEQNKNAERYGRITVSSGDKSEYVQVKQNGGIRFSKQEVFCTSGAGTSEVVVYESDDWSVQSDADWITVNRQNEKVHIAYVANMSLNSRTAAIIVKGEGQERNFNVVQEGSGVTEVSEHAGYELVWHDEFNDGTELDAEHWRHEVQHSGWVNNELQNYVDGAVKGKCVTELSDGKLRIHCFKGDDGKIYSGRVYAHEKEGWRYGYFEARIMLPKGKGTWPAFG